MVMTTDVWCTRIPLVVFIKSSARKDLLLSKSTDEGSITITLCLYIVNDLERFVIDSSIKGVRDDVQYKKMYLRY